MSTTERFFYTRGYSILTGAISSRHAGECILYNALPRRTFPWETYISVTPAGKPRIPSRSTSGSLTLMTHPVAILRHTYLQLHFLTRNSNSNFMFLVFRFHFIRCIAVVICLSLCLSVCHTSVLCRNDRAHHQAIITGL